MLGSKIKMANRKIKRAFWDSFFSLLVQIQCRRVLFIKKLLKFERFHLCCLEKNCLTLSNSGYFQGPQMVWLWEKTESGEAGEQEHLLLPYWNDLRGINLSRYGHSGYVVYVPIRTASNVLFSKCRGKKRKGKLDFKSAL